MRLSWVKECLGESFTGDKQHASQSIKEDESWNDSYFNVFFCY